VEISTQNSSHDKYLVHQDTCRKRRLWCKASRAHALEHRDIELAKAGRVANDFDGLFVIVFLQVGLGYRRLYWLHVPIGVGMFGGLMRQVEKLTPQRTIGARS
jgi:hypothetical protein